MARKNRKNIDDLINQRAKELLAAKSLTNQIPEWAVSTSDEVTLETFFTCVNLGVELPIIEKKLKINSLFFISNKFIENKIDLNKAIEILNWCVKNNSIADNKSDVIHILFPLIKKKDGTKIADILIKYGYNVGASFSWGPKDNQISGPLFCAIAYYAKSFNDGAFIDAILWCHEHFPETINKRTTAGSTALGIINEFIKLGDKSFVEAAKIILNLGADPNGVLLTPEAAAANEIKPFLIAALEKKQLNETIVSNDSSSVVTSKTFKL